MASTAPSSSLARAAGSEFERIERLLTGLSQRRAVIEAQLAELDAEMSALRERQQLLQLLVPGAGGAGGPLDAPPITAGKVLKGRALRRVAGRLLWQLQGEGEIHYREWFERVMAAGYVVRGKEPAAAFLTNVRDSPAVTRGSRPGYYRLDPARRERLAQRLGEAHAELADVTELLDRTRHAETSLDAADRLRTHRDALTQRIRRLELDARELDAIFASEAEPAETDSRRDLQAA
jgi:DNA-binding transcriptional MerR regulator